MNRIISNIIVCLASVTVLFSACKKDSDGSPDVKAGNPVAERISPDSAGSGTMLTLTGSGLGQMRSIVFDKNNAPALFYSTLNTSNALIFRVPDTATRGQQNIILTNSEGRILTVPFKVLPFALVKSAFPTDFEPGTRITLTGNNLDVLSKVVLNGTTNEATIISRSMTSAVIEMPASDVAKATLVLTTTAGDKATPMDFVNVNKATVQVFTDDLVSPAQNWSWGGTYTPSADDIVTGSKSLKAAYDPSGSWGGLKIHMGSEVTLPSGTKYFTFWAKGADEEKKVTVQVLGNEGKNDNKTEITVPPGKWTYFKLECSSFMPNVASVTEIVFQIHEAGKTIYYDNILFIK